MIVNTHSGFSCMPRETSVHTTPRPDLRQSPVLPWQLLRLRERACVGPFIDVPLPSARANGCGRPSTCFTRLLLLAAGETRPTWLNSIRRGKFGLLELTNDPEPQRLSEACDFSGKRLPIKNR